MITLCENSLLTAVIFALLPRAVGFDHSAGRLRR